MICTNAARVVWTHRSGSWSSLEDNSVYFLLHLDLEKGWQNCAIFASLMSALVLPTCMTASVLTSSWLYSRLKRARRLLGSCEAALLAVDGDKEVPAISRDHCTPRCQQCYMKERQGCRRTKSIADQGIVHRPGDQVYGTRERESESVKRVLLRWCRVRRVGPLAITMA